MEEDGEGGGGCCCMMVVSLPLRPPLTEALTKRRQRGEEEDLGGNVGIFFSSKGIVWLV